MSIPSFTPTYGYARFSTLLFPTTAPATEATAAAVTFTAAQLLAGLVLRDPNGAGRADLLPTAATLVAAIEGAAIGCSFYVDIRNTADAAETITLTANTGATISGTATIAQNNSKRLLIRLTGVAAGSEAYVAYSLGTAVH